MSLTFEKVTVGSSLNFAKDVGTAITGGTLTFNLDWGTKNGRAVDLDAMLLVEGRKDLNPTVTKPSFFGKLFGAKPTVNKTMKNISTDFVYFGNLSAVGVRHHGDDLTGASASGEFIEVNLDELPSHVNTLTFGILSFSGDRFCDLPFANIKVFQGSPRMPIRGLAETKLTSFKESTKSIVIAQLKRNNLGEWVMTAHAVEGDSKDVSSLKRLCEGV